LPVCWQAGVAMLASFGFVVAATRLFHKIISRKYLTKIKNLFDILAGNFIQKGKIIQANYFPSVQHRL